LKIRARISPLGLPFIEHDDQSTIPTTAEWLRPASIKPLGLFGWLSHAWRTMTVIAAWTASRNAK
jgi:hypothetical protein